MNVNCSNCTRPRIIVNKKFVLCQECNFERMHGKSYAEHQKEQQEKNFKAMQLRSFQKMQKQPVKLAKPIKKVSGKRQKENALYSKKRGAYLNLNKICMARLNCCTYDATEVHHMQGRENDLLLDEDKWLAICRKCHTWITENSAVAIAMGLSFRRNV